jgi:hypothetical protein
VNENDEIAREMEEENRRREKNGNRPLKVERQQLTGAKIVWTVGAVIVDVITGYAVWQITFWWYGALWVIAGSGGLIYSNWLRERIGNNYDQKQIARYGLNLSWISIALMGLISGAVYILGYTRIQWVEVMTLVVVFSLFIYHVYQSHRFQILDDEYIEMNEEARELEEHARELRRIHRAARKVESKKKERGVIQEYGDKHGAAFDAAYGKKMQNGQTELTRNYNAEDVVPKLNGGSNQSDQTRPK